MLSNHNSWHRTRIWFWLLLVLTALLRLISLNRIPPGLWYDEAIYALDGASVGHGNWPIFFTTEGHPREPLYIYSLGGFFALFGVSTLNARIVSAIWGTVTVGAFYWFARMALGDGGNGNDGNYEKNAVTSNNSHSSHYSHSSDLSQASHSSPSAAWPLVAMFSLAALRWHLHFSRAIFRALLPPLFVLLVALAFLRWRETRRTRWLVACGVALGAGMYTYLSFRLVPLLLVAWFAWLGAKRILSRSELLRATAIVAAVAFLVFLPLGIDYVRNPSHFGGRTGEVSMFRKQVETKEPDGKTLTLEVPKTAAEAVHDLLGNALDIAKMWTIRGDHVGKHNLPYAPVFDWVSGCVFYLGLAWCCWNWRREEFAFLSLAWIFVFSLASVFSFGAPNLLRMQGMTPAVALVYTFGLREIYRFSRKRASRAACVSICGALLLLFSAIQLDTYFRRFPASAAVHQEFQKETFFDPGIDVKEIAPTVLHVFVPDDVANHPTFRFASYGTKNITSFLPEKGPPAEATSNSAILITSYSEKLAAAAGRSFAGIVSPSTMRRAADYRVPIENPETHEVQWLPWAALYVSRDGAH